MRIIARLLPLALALTVLTACHREPSAMKPGDLPQYSASSLPILKVPNFTASR